MTRLETMEEKEGAEERRRRMGKGKEERKERRKLGRREGREGERKEKEGS